MQPRRIEDNRLSLEYETGSRIVSLPSKEATVRGFSGVDLIVGDEAARIPDDLMAAVRPMLAISNGKLLLMSTPFGKRGFFHSAWEDGGDTWERIRITAHECPRIVEAFLQEERREIGDLWFRSEYLVEFCDTVDSVFAYEDIMAAFCDTVEPLEFEGVG